MLADSSFASWNHYDVFGMPTAVLVSPAGDAIHTFDGVFDGAEVLARLG